MHRIIDEAVPIGLFLLDSACRVRYWNRAMEEYSGLRRRDVLGRQVTEVLPGLEPHGHRVAGVVDSGIAFRVEQVVKDTAKGDHVSDAYWFGPLVLDDGSAAVLAVMEDTTRRIRVDTQLIRSERLAAIGELAAGVAHNFNNILAAIGGDAQLLKLMAEEEGLPQHVIDAAQQICEETMRGGRIAHDLLSFARGAAPQIQQLSALDVVEDAARLIQNHPAARPVAITVAIDRDLPDVEADPHLLHQVFFNVMLNALQAMPGGGVLTVSAALRSHEQDPRRGIVDLKFHDTGVGIPREHLRRIFDPFFTQRVGGSSGTGLGLPVSLAMVKSIGGDIQVASAERIGTTVTVSLPIVERRNLPRGARREPHGTALVIETDEKLRRTLVAILARRGFEVEAFGAVDEALEAFAAGLEVQPYELVLMEWSASPESPLTVLQRLRALDPSVPVIVLTGMTEPNQLAEALSAGAAFAFSKPPNFTELLAAAEHLVRSQRPGSHVSEIRRGWR
jgi:PAS domain S-box-containing protein